MWRVVRPGDRSATVHFGGGHNAPDRDPAVHVDLVDVLASGDHRAPGHDNCDTAAPTEPPTTLGCPDNLADSLATTGGADQLVTVEGSSYDTTYATVELWTRHGTCWDAAAGPWTGRIGENGFSDHHREGDGTTPTGIYGFEQIVYGNAPNPGTRLPYYLLKCGDWWDEDPTSAEYNTFQVVPCGTSPDFGGGSEALWEEPGPYPSFIPIEYNTDPIIKGAGSAIFFHADTGSPTVGCVSVPVSDLDFFLRWLDPGSGSRIVMGPASELTDF